MSGVWPPVVMALKEPEILKLVLFNPLHLHNQQWHFVGAVETTKPFCQPASGATESDPL